MSGPVTLQMMNAEKAQPFLYAFDAQFQTAMAQNGEASDYLDKYTFKPNINPGTNIVRMPIPLSAPEMKLFKGRRHYRKNSTGFLDLTSVPYDDGVQEDADKMAAFDWTGFSTSAESIALTIAGWQTKAICDLLNVGESTTDWTGGNFLATAKNANPFKPVVAHRYKTWWSGAKLNTTNVELMIADMVSRRGFNGGSLGFGISNMVLFSSSVLFPTARSITLDERLTNGASNPAVKWGLVAEAWPDLAADRWGILQIGSAVKSHPAFGAIKDSPTVLISGKDSPMYHDTNQMGYNVKLRMGVGLLRSEAISVAEEP
jgi:hypothetical protein